MNEDYKPERVMGKVCNKEQHCQESFWEIILRFEKRTHPGMRDTTDFFGERDRKYELAELMVLAVVKRQTDTTTATPSLTPFAVLMQTLDLIPVQSQIPQRTSQPGSCLMRLGSEEPESYKGIASQLPDEVANSPPIENAHHVNGINSDP